VSNFESNTVTEVAGRAIVARHEAAPGPLGLLALPEGKVLVMDYYSNSVSFIDPAAKSSRTVRLPCANPTQGALSSDRGSAWIVCSGTDGHLVQLDLESSQIVRDVPIDGLSFGIALVPGKTH